MTNTANPLDDLFAARSLADVHTDLTNLMAELRATDSPHREEARELFKKNQQAKTDVEAAEDLLRQIRDLGKPAPTNLTLPAQDAQAAAPAPAPVAVEPMPTVQYRVPVEAAQDVPSDPTPAPLADALAPVETESAQDHLPAEPDDVSLPQEDEPDTELGAEDAPEEDEAPGEEASDEVAETEATLAPAPVLPTATIEWPDGTLGEGLFSQLAATLGAGESLTLVLVRAKSQPQLLVTVQPVPITGELNTTALPLQINGTPVALDAELAARMTAFRAARAVARDTTDYLAQVKAAADQAKKTAEDARKKASKSTPSTTPTAKKPATEGSLKLEIAPADAMIVVTDRAGKTHPVKNNKDLSLPIGEYTIIVEADGYARHEEKLTVRAGHLTKTAVVLTKTTAERLL